MKKFLLAATATLGFAMAGAAPANAGVKFFGYQMPQNHGPFGGFQQPQNNGPFGGFQPPHNNFNDGPHFDKPDYDKPHWGNGDHYADCNPVPGIPEPASWLTLIAGFGFIGAAMRRRQVKSVVA